MWFSSITIYLWHLIVKETTNMMCLLSQSSINLMFSTTHNCLLLCRRNVTNKSKPEPLRNFQLISAFTAQHFCHLALYLFPLCCGCWIMAIFWVIFFYPFVSIHSRPFHYIQSRSFTQLVWITPDCRMPRGNGPVLKTGCANSNRTSQTKPKVSKSR